MVNFDWAVHYVQFSYVSTTNFTKRVILCIIIGGYTSIYRPLCYPFRSLKSNSDYLCGQGDRNYHGHGGGGGDHHRNFHGGYNQQQNNRANNRDQMMDMRNNRQHQVQK